MTQVQQHPTSDVMSSGDERVIKYRLEAAEVDWEIAPARTVRGYAFNGQVPGPVLEAEQGVPLEIECTNRLPEPTVIHWHGLRIPAAMDGTEVVQRAVQPGETFTYLFTPPDAGTFWYQPHANETEQLEKGLYGALIVRAADELALAGEKILVFEHRVTSATARRMTSRSSVAPGTTAMRPLKRSRFATLWARQTPTTS